MSFVLTLMAPPLAPCLTAAHEEWAKEMVRTAGGEPDTVQWLAPDMAFDLYFNKGTLSAEVIEEKLEETFPDAPIDIALQPTEGRRKQLLLADMDSTLIEQECLDELAAFAGLKEKVAGITERAMAGELAFEPALRERVALLKGLSETALGEAFKKHITFTPGGRALVQTMSAHGAHTCLVSGGFTFFTEKVASHLGFHEHHGNTLIAKDSVLTGEVGSPILGKQAKLETLRRLISEHNLDPALTMAVGDGANDAAMIEAAGLGIAFHPHAILAKAANVRVRHGDLTALLYMQGYSQDEFHS